MGLKAIIFQNINGSLNERTITGSATLNAGDNIVYVNNTSGAAMNLTLPPSPADKQLLLIKDIAGNAAAHNITLIGTIDGQTNPVIGVNYGGGIFNANGSSWSEFA